MTFLPAITAALRCGYGRYTALRIEKGTAQGRNLVRCFLSLALHFRQHRRLPRAPIENAALVLADLR